MNQETNMDADVDVYYGPDIKMLNRKPQVSSSHKAVDSGISVSVTTT